MRPAGLTGAESLPWPSPRRKLPWTPPGIAGSASAASGRGCRAVGYFVDFTSDPIDTIVGQAGGGMSRVSFVSGGSEATDRHQDRPALSSHPRPCRPQPFLRAPGRVPRLRQP